MSKWSRKHYNTKFLWSEDLDGPYHKREKDQWFKIVSTMPSYNLVKTARRLLWKRFVEVMFENWWKEDPQSTIHKLWKKFCEDELRKQFQENSKRTPAIRNHQLRNMFCGRQIVETILIKSKIRPANRNLQLRKEGVPTDCENIVVEG